MRKHSHARETFSHFLVAIALVTIGAAVIGWAYSTFETGCEVGIQCHPSLSQHVAYQ
ncbi:MAG: hypothetical protein ACTHLA_16245 [Asticcacaulis sp.]|uniref:hypothetical protein n=1 Tax=Asticcacaulis sp. TaxID=1872648 RepID=UPI003F7BD313